LACLQSKFVGNIFMAVFWSPTFSRTIVDFLCLLLLYTLALSIHIWSRDGSA
jgi:hypothetical protein